MDPAELAGTVVPYVSAVAGYYGSALWDKVEEQTADAAADATVSLGRQLLRRLLGRGESRDAIRSAVTDTAENPEDDDCIAGLRLQIRKAFETDAGLARDVSEMLADAGVRIEASGRRSVAAKEISGVVVTGDHSTIQR
jgi:hypothetical protein